MKRTGYNFEKHLIILYRLKESAIDHGDDRMAYQQLTSYVKSLPLRKALGRFLGGF
jgi:hypothetical protein